MLRRSSLCETFVLALLIFSPALHAHPMGNFSISHYSRLEIAPESVQLTYVLDFAEIPTLELFQKWGVEPGSATAVPAKAKLEAREWLRHLTLREGNKALTPALQDCRVQLSDGAGGMQVMRVTIRAAAAIEPGAAGGFHYEDGNYTSRAGWKEIVLQPRPGVKLLQASHTARDLSRELTSYPADPTVAPPQDLKASFALPAMPVAARPPRPAAGPDPLPAPASAGFAAAQPAAAGAVTRGDYLSNMLHQRNFAWTTILLGIAVAFGLGGMHALSPGHGKTIVAAYLVGSRGTWKHAIYLGLIVTFTHTMSVFLLGVGVLFFQQYIVPEKVIPVLGAISGGSVGLIGAWLLYKRSLLLLEGGAEGPGHSHSHPFSHEHSHEDGGAHTHTHDGSTHSHAIPEGRITAAGLIALGASGGLVPCPSALVLLLGAIALGQTALGLVLLVGFSAGLAVVLMTIGALVLYAKNLLPSGEYRLRHPLLRIAPVFSAVVVMMLGVLMTLSALGVVKA